MNSISGLSVLKKPFSWKFTKYHRFQKKIKLQIKQKEDEVSVKDALNMSWEDEPESYTVLEVGTPPDSGIHEPCPQFCWDFDRKRKKQKRPPNAKRADDSEVDSDLGSETEEDGVYSTVAEDARRSSQYWSLPGALGTVPLYENASKKKATKHFYENYRLSSSLSSSDEDETATGSSGENEELEHIYDYVENVHEGGSPLGKSYPVNVFLSLIEGADNTISPDPNIYEVPPGAILNLAGSPPDNHSMHNITPPNGFKDTLTWGRRHELSSLPVDALYSSVVKPKRKKVKKRPGLDVLKNLTAQEDVDAHTVTSTGEEVKEKPGTAKEGQEVEALEVYSKNESLKSDSKKESLKLDPKNKEDAKVSPEVAPEGVLAKSSVTSSNEPVKKEEGTRVAEVRTESEVEKATKELRNAVGKIGRSRRQNEAVEPSAEVDKVAAELTVAENKAAKPGCRAEKKTKERPARKPKPAIKPESTDKEAPILPEALDKAEIGKAVDSKQSFKEENAELSSETRGGKNEASVTDESKIKESEPCKEAVIKSKEVTAENHESSEKLSKSPQNKIKSDTNERAEKSDGSQGTLRRKKGKAKHAPNVKSPEETASPPAGDSCPPENNLKPTSVNKKKQNKNSRPDPKEKMKSSKAPAKNDRPKAEDSDAASRPPIIPILKKVVNEKPTPSQERYLKRQISHSPLETIDQSDEKNKANKLITPPEASANKTEKNDQVGETPQNSTCEPKEKLSTQIKFCGKDETSKALELDDASHLFSEKETEQTKLTSFSENLQQNTPIAIEISDDGTWGSADPNSTSEKAETESSEKCEELKSSDFLNANLSAEDIKMQHVLSEYGNSYFIQTANKPVEKKSSKPAGAHNHVGNKGKVQNSAPAQRCSLRDELKRFVRESEMAAQRALEAEKDLPKEQQPEKIVGSELTPQEIHKLESGTEAEDAEMLAKGRKGVLEKTMVRAKKRDSWIKGEDVTLSTDKERRIDDWLSTGAQQLSLPAKLPEEIYDLAMDPNISLLITKEGEIVYDSIIQNKHKTKTYWEQLMMAAEMGTQPPAPPLLKQFNGDCQDDKAHSEISEDFYDAESHNSLNSPELHSLEAGLVGPKIVEKVAKKLLEAVESRPTKRATEESVIEREIKLQRERELALVREREAAAAKAQARAPEMKTLGGSLSPEVTTVLKEADDEWRRRSCKDEDLFNSIPTTDEGNCSEYGSEGKDDFSPETNNSRVMSPEVEMGGQIHQRTQSMDSMSSGHSSGSSSGLSSHLDCSYVSVNARRRGITVKPLDEPEEENSTFFRNERETPIEREIRLAREREEELRREKNNNMNNIIKSNENPPTHQNKTMNSTNFSSRNSINVEQELLIIKAEENIDVQSKVNQLNSLSQRSKSNDKKPAPLQLKKHLSKSVVNLSCAKELESELTVPSPTSPAAPNSHFKKFVGAPATQKRGLMKRFLESRGKLGSTFTLNAPALNSEPIKKLSTFSSPNSNQNCVSVVNAPPRKHYVKKIQNKEENSSIGTRPGYKSAEEKIQNELMEMRRREEELRRQRAFSLARSQPNLLSLIDGEGEIVDNEKEKDIEILDRLPPMSKLRTALSNPNLLDVDEKPVQKKIQQRKKSALITEWENRIQKNIE